MPSRMLFIGITGGVGAGKTTVMNYIGEHYNARILFADEIARELCMPGHGCYEELRTAFPDPLFWNPDGTMHREAFAKAVFSDEAQRNVLNRLVHPAVKRYIINEFEKEKRAGRYAFLMLEAALLIEEHYDEICDELWYIYASEETRRQRLSESRGYTPERIRQIFASQLPENVYRHYCEAVIDNDGSRERMAASLERAFAAAGDE